jgi:hypothetical protein
MARIDAKTKIANCNALPSEGDPPIVPRSTKEDVSRVRDMSLGGLFLDTRCPFVE